MAGGGNSRTARGRRAEAVAARYLLGRGYELLARNVRLGRGEIDIVARDREEIVFVEVRSRAAGAPVPPEASIGPVKRRRLADAAQRWLGRAGLGCALCRFDVVAVEFGPAGTRVRHIAGAFAIEDR